MVVFTKTHPRHHTTLKFYPRRGMIVTRIDGRNGTVWKFNRIYQTTARNPREIPPFANVTKRNIRDWEFNPSTLLVVARFGRNKIYSYEFVRDQQA